jgi:F0F1-type ATP synthase membrane subunit a
MAFVLKFGKPLSMLVACVACMVCTGTLVPYINTVYIKKTGETKSTTAEKATAITFSVIMCIALIVYQILKMFV